MRLEYTEEEYEKLIDLATPLFDDRPNARVKIAFLAEMIIRIINSIDEQEEYEQEQSERKENVNS